MTIDPKTGLPRGEKPPASTAAVVALVCGILLCLGPFTGVAGDHCRRHRAQGSASSAADRGRRRDGAGGHPARGAEPDLGRNRWSGVDVAGLEPELMQLGS